jgi:hypothetical protein
MVRYLYSAALLYRVVVEVDVGAFVEAMVRGLVGWWGEIVMNVCKAAQVSVCFFFFFWNVSNSQCHQRHFTRLWRHCVGVSGWSGFHDI